MSISVLCQPLAASLCEDGVHGLALVWGTYHAETCANNKNQTIVIKEYSTAQNNARNGGSGGGGGGG